MSSSTIPHPAPAPRTPAGVRPALPAAGALALLAALVLVSLSVGSRPIPVGTVLDVLSGGGAPGIDTTIVLDLRLPRSVLGLVVGAALGVAGALMQGLTRNPLADPGTLGINAGAALAVVVGIALLGITNPLGYVWLAIAGASVVAVVVYAIGGRGPRGSAPMTLAIAGAALSAMAASATTGLLIVDRGTLDDYRFWAVGSLEGRDWSILLLTAPLIGAGALIALALAAPLNALALGDDVARALGHRIGRIRVGATVATVLLSGAATAAAGPVGFVGLVVPHAARLLVGTDQRRVLRLSALLGACLLLGADVVGRVVARPVELETGIVTALVGGPCFVLLARRRRLVGE